MRATTNREMPTSSRLQLSARKFAGRGKQFQQEYDSSKKTLFHQRVDIAGKVLRGWRCHKVRQTAKRAQF